MFKHKDSGFDVFIRGINNGYIHDEFVEKLSKVNKNIRCYIPEVENWTRASISLENLVKDSTKYHAYVFTPHNSEVYSIAEVIDSAHDTGKNVYFCILEEYLNDDGSMTYWEPIVRNSLSAVSNLLLLHGASKTKSIDELVEKLSEDFNNQNIIKGTTE